MKSAITREQVLRVAAQRKKKISWNTICEKTRNSETAWKAAAKRFNVKLPHRARMAPSAD